jgi:hypothetical protein
MSVVSLKARDNERSITRPADCMYRSLTSFEMTSGGLRGLYYFPPSIAFLINLTGVFPWLRNFSLNSFSLYLSAPTLVL